MPPPSSLPGLDNDLFGDFNQVTNTSANTSQGYTGGGDSLLDF